MHHLSAYCSGKVFSLAHIRQSPLVSFPALNPIKPHAPPVAVLPRQFLQVSALRPYSPGGGLNGFPPTPGWLIAIPMSSPHRLRPGLPGYLIPFAPLAFVPHRRTRSRRATSPLVVLRGLQDCDLQSNSHHQWCSADFTPTPGVPSPSPGP